MMAGFVSYWRDLTLVGKVLGLNTRARLRHRRHRDEVLLS